MARHPDKSGHRGKSAGKRQDAGRKPTVRAHKRQDTVAGRATKRRNVGRRPTNPGGIAPGNIRLPVARRRTPARRR